MSEIREYVKALNDPDLPEATLVWTNRHSAVIHTQLKSDQSISVQISYNPGWRAAIGGRAQNVGRDGLGFLDLKPSCEKGCEIQLAYDGGLEWRATWLASALAMIAVLGIAVLRWSPLAPR